VKLSEKSGNNSAKYNKEIFMRRLILLLVLFISLNSTEAFSAMPDVVWAGGGIMASNESRPGYMADTMIYFGTYGSTVFFTNPMLTLKNEKLGISIGGGGRFALFSDEIIGGLNGYFDYNNDHNHRRFAVGAEAFHKYGECHVNAYLPTSGMNSGEEALPGFDLNVGIPVPNYAFITIWPGIYYYSGRNGKDMQGLSFKLKAQPIKPVEIYLGARNDAPESGRNDNEIFAGIDITIPISGFDIDKMLKFYNPAYPIDIKSKLDSRVVRERFISYDYKDN
jgi:hypothetical protein